MKKIDPAVLRETAYVAAVALVLSVIMQVVFVLLGKWDYRVILGNAWSILAVVLNFLLMGITVQKAVSLDDNAAKKTIGTSLVLRTFMMFVILVLGVVLPFFNTWAVIIPMFFTRIAFFIKPIFNKKSKKQGGEG